MKYDRHPSFLADYDRLSVRDQVLFMDAVRKMIEASRREPGRIPHWPASLRVKPVRDYPGVYEMTWSFAGPYGRATFEIISEAGEPILRWRRVGDHSIIREP